MRSSSERILTTHTGSLPRPDDVVNLMLAESSGRQVDEAAVEAALRSAVAGIVKRQLDLGVDIIDDGEQSKSGFIAYLNDRLGGFEPYELPPGAGLFSASREFIDFPEFYQTQGGPGGQTAHMVCTGPVTYTGGVQLRRDLANLKAAIGSRPVSDVFVPSASPASVEAWQKNAYYATQEEFLYAIADAMREEYQGIVDAGFLVQLDDPMLATQYTMDPNLTVSDLLAWGKVRVDVLNYALRDIAPDRVRYHTCYGINMGPRTSDLELKYFIDLVFSVRAGALSFEAANPRHEHEWELFEHVKLPDDKLLIPGVITHTSVLVEHPDVVAQRIVRFANVVGRERVIAGTDCGFATNPGGVPEVHPTIVWAKFQALVEGARRASKALWR
jgi:5-methyltetrahydropteroyltriglutamate--homocysteine methyltransferase